MYINVFMGRNSYSKHTTWGLLVRKRSSADEHVRGRINVIPAPPRVRKNSDVPPSITSPEYIGNILLVICVILLVFRGKRGLRASQTHTERARTVVLI